MSKPISFYMQAFSKKVQAMQPGNKTLTLTAEEAKGLHFEVFDMLAKNAEMGRLMNETYMVQEPISIELSGGSFQSKTK